VAIDADTKLERKASKIALGRNISRARELASLTQEKVTATLTLKQGELSAVEKGKRALSFLGYQRLAEAIGCGLDDFRISKSQLQAEISKLLSKSRDPAAQNTHPQ
jgi:transcriptional regulator with XRE-family HTH domain